MEANKNLLQRDVAREQARLEVGDVQEVVREMVDEGTQLLARLTMQAGSTGKPRPYHATLLLLLRHVIEQLDAVDELLREAITAPAMLQMRAIVEAHAQMLYLSATREAFSPSPVDARIPSPIPIDTAGNPVHGAALAAVQDFRGTAYLVADLRQRLRESERLLTGNVEGWMLRLAGRSLAPALVRDPEKQSELQAVIAAVTAELNSPQNGPINAEFDVTKGNRRFDPPWYALAHGPPSVYQLALSVGLVAEYELFYSPASAVMHGQDVRGQLGKKRDTGGHSVAPLRSGAYLELVVWKAIIETVRIYSHVIAAIRPTDKAQWDGWAKRWTGVLRGEG